LPISFPSLLLLAGACTPNPVRALFASYYNVMIRRQCKLNVKSKAMRIMKDPE
jgi:hypothetical protein